MDKIAILDIDGVITNALGYVDEWGRRLGRKDIRGEGLAVYDVRKQWPDADYSVFEEICTDPEFISNMMPLRSATTGFFALIGLGLMPIFVTSRPPSIFVETDEWLVRYGFFAPAVGWPVLASSYGIKKSAVIRGLSSRWGKPAMFVDDNRENIDDVKAHFSDIDSYLLGWKYNGSVMSWDDIIASEWILWRGQKNSTRST